MLEIAVILNFLVYFLFGIPIVIFGLYGIILLYYSRHKNNNFKVNGISNENEKFEPYVSVVIATHNEESIISKRIENILGSNYPSEKLEIIFADDSDDSTPTIIGDYSNKFSKIRLIKFHERLGYSPSMVAGCKAAKGEIIVLGDAGSFLDPQAIQNLVIHFKEPDIGVVTGQDMILNINEGVGKSENLYLKFYNFLRSSETNMDSTFFIKGEATAVRSVLIKDLENCFETFDTSVGLYSRQKGYRVIFDPKVKFYEFAPLTHTDRIKQKSIRAINLIRIILRFKHLMFNRKYGKYGLLILPMNFAMLVIAPVAILAGFILLIPLTFFNLALSAIIWGIVGFLLLFTFVFLRNVLVTFLDFEYSLLKALYQLITRKKDTDKIEKVISTRRAAEL